MAQVIIIGGHGKVALLLAPLLTERGDGVTSIIRNPDHAPAVEATGARAVVADVESLDAAAIAELLRGHDAVVWSAGAGGGNPARTRAGDRHAAIRTADAADPAGARRHGIDCRLGARAGRSTPANPAGCGASSSAPPSGRAPITGFLPTARSSPTPRRRPPPMSTCAPPPSNGRSSRPAASPSRSPAAASTSSPRLPPAAAPTPPGPTSPTSCAPCWMPPPRPGA